jgi:Tol biopolymer transport system component
MIRRLRTSVFLAICLALASAAVTTPAVASFPGSNGKMAYTGSDDSDDEIYAVNADGSGLQQLTSNGTQDEEPSWSADGTRIAFARDYDIWVMDADGGNKTQLTVSGDYVKPAWSPDGSQIAMGLLAGGIAVMDADGSHIHVLTPPGDNSDDPNWSPDGTRIAFLSYRSGNSDIYLIDPDGSNETRLTSRRPDDYDPNWSPDGSMIAFSRFGKKSEYGDIHVVSLDGSVHLRLTRRAAYDVNPVWSPDGTKIAWERCASFDLKGIYVMNADGSGKTEVTSAHYGCTGAYPDWQPLP